MVILVKIYLKLIIGAFVVGGLLAYFFYRDIKSEVNALENQDGPLYLFQVGVFQNPANAENFASNFDSSIVYKDADFYRVITCLTANSETKDKLYAYYKDEGINFYVKKVTLDSRLKNEIAAGEKVLSKTKVPEALNEVCQNLLNSFILYA